MPNYREVHAWQLSRALANEIYEVSSQFPKTETFGLSLQLRRAVVSVASNIAEGYGRWSRRELVHFLYIARGSLLELETQVIIAGDLEFIESDRVEKVLSASSAIGNKLNGLIRYYKSDAAEPPEP